LLATIYWGVGNAAPWPGDAHPGDNLYTTSVLGLDPETGKIKTHFQYHQNDSWDWDEVEAPILVDLQRDGRTIKSLIHPGRNAIFWILERKPVVCREYRTDLMLFGLSDRTFNEFVSGNVGAFQPRF
jgi:glucose dehydrogenase